MAGETYLPETANRLRKRKAGKLKKNKKQKQVLGPKEKVKKIDPKLRKLLRKKARDYNSDDEEEQEQEVENQQGGFGGLGKAGNFGREGEDFVEEEEFGSEDEEGTEDEEGEEGEQGGIEPGITRFIEGCRAFRIAFKSITKKTVVADDDPLGPVLSGHKKLVAEKLAEEDAEKKIKGETKKEKLLAGEKGHVKPANYLDTHEKFLIGVATKGVVKLFNAVNKAQHAQKGLNPSRSKDAKVMKKRRKEAFFSELAKTPVTETAKEHTSAGPGDSGGPSWAPLRDNYMLTSSKLKDWDKMPDTLVEDDIGKMSADSSSDDD